MSIAALASSMGQCSFCCILAPRTSAARSFNDRLFLSLLKTSYSDVSLMSFFGWLSSSTLRSLCSA
uniref:Uncharacterized protein n=1 Tax=Zea mays TaxID=4577 RepID=C4J8Q6_MAIZE|nr:unknown [Zea mays]